MHVDHPYGGRSHHGDIEKGIVDHPAVLWAKEWVDDFAIVFMNEKSYASILVKTLSWFSFYIICISFSISVQWIKFWWYFDNGY